MVVSDVGSRQRRGRAAGDRFVSVTQHAHPFRIPYGASFYAALAPSRARDCT